MQTYKLRFSPVLRLFLLITAILLSPNLAAFAASSSPQYSWLQFGANGIEARALMQGSQCPDIVIDGKRKPMRMRAAASSAFSLTSCESNVSKDAKAISVAEQTLPAPNWDPQRIVVIGDTGCRINEGNIQDCNNAKYWPFTQIAAQAAKAKPDLIIHVGDYYYRRSACPDGNKACEGSPHGDDWPAWEADFFKPAAPLLKAAPLVMARGNHESCEDGGYGWFRLLDTHPYTSACSDHTAPYAVRMSAFTLFVVDNSGIDLAKTAAENEERFRSYLDALGKLNAKNTWLVMHRPLWMVRGEQQSPNPGKSSITKIGDPTWVESVPSIIQLVLSGHYHTFETLNFANRPAQVIAGNSGTKLEPLAVEGDLTGIEVAGQIIQQGIAIHKFGYLLLEKSAEGWNGKVYSQRGQVMAVCNLLGKQFSCQ